MRDLAVVLFLALMLILAFRRPNIGLALWLWTALITPNYLLYGFARGLRFNLIAAAITIFSWIITEKKEKFPNDLLPVLVLLFLVWTFVSSQLAIYSSPIIDREFGRFFRGTTLFVFGLLVLTRRKDLELAAWAIVLSIGFYSGVEGLKFISSGGTHHIFGPSGSNLHDNNHLALAMNMMLPFAIYLALQQRIKIVKLGFLIFIGVSILAVVGTFSRGGFLGLAILLVTWIVFSRRKVLALILAISMLSVIVKYVPSSYFDRIDTISEVEEDSSFAGRIVAWKQSVLIALDNPFTGGGFYAVQTYAVWQHYARDFDKLSFIESPSASSYNFKAAHSIYFQVLGDQGFVGLALYLSIFLGAGFKAIKLTKTKLPEHAQWIRSFAGACLLSLLMFGTCGALLSLAYFELSFFIVALICISGKLASQAQLSELK